MNKAFKKLGYTEKRDGSVVPFVFQPNTKAVVTTAPTVKIQTFSCPKCSGIASVRPCVSLRPYSHLLRCVAECGFWTFDTKDKRRQILKDFKRWLRSRAEKLAEKEIANG